MICRSLFCFRSSRFDLHLPEPCSLSAIQLVFFCCWKVMVSWGLSTVQLHVRINILHSLVNLAMHTTMTSFSPPSNSQQSPQVWFTDSEATNHMTADLSNLSLASPYPSNETIQSSNCKW
nr:uncharacterized protein LOC108172666 isoform X2 [Malus domestica]